MRLYLNQSADAAAHVLAIGQGFGLTKSTNAERNCSEVTIHVDVLNPRYMRVRD